MKVYKFKEHKNGEFENHVYHAKLFMSCLQMQITTICNYSYTAVVHYYNNTMRLSILSPTTPLPGLLGD